MSAPRICCLDLDTFFVSVERLLDPSLVGQPVVVGASPGQRGVVTACSYEVRALGVRSGMAIAEAVRLAPDAIYLPTRHGVYAPYAGRVREVLALHTPSVQTASIDEFYLDFTGCERLYHRAGDVDGDATIERTLREICARIKREVGLPASVGIGVTRAIAKIASGVAKPAGVRLVRAGAERGFLAPLPVRKFPGIGPVTEERLRRAGVATLGELVALPPGPTRARFGGLVDLIAAELAGEVGAWIGRDRPAFLEHDPEGATGGSISNERTFAHDVGDRGAVERQLLALVERVCWRARGRGVRARTVTLRLRWADFVTVTRGRTLPATNHDPDVWACVRALAAAAQAERPGARVRLVGVKLSGLVVATQLELPLDAPARAPVDDAVDGVRDRFGFDAIRLGAVDGRQRWLEAEPRPRPGAGRDEVSSSGRPRRR
ncbi:MAG: DNA polymerase IV [Myxococcales bacterium]|nr:DNA polymerase IV [Myxococcales bacterium]